MSLEGGEQTGCCPPLPICAEGGAGHSAGQQGPTPGPGTQAHPPWQSSPAWPPLLYSRCPGRKKRGRREGVKREEGREYSSQVGLRGHCVRHSPTRPRETQEERNCPQPTTGATTHLDLQVQSGTDIPPSTPRIHSTPTPPPSSSKNPPTRNVITSCLSDKHQPSPVPRVQPPSPCRHGAKVCRHLRPAAVGPGPTHHRTHRGTYVIHSLKPRDTPYLSQCTSPISSPLLQPDTCTPYRLHSTTGLRSHTHSLALHPSHGGPGPLPD